MVDANLVAHNLDSLAVALPGERARPHVKAHKCTALAKLQVERGHPGLTCATIREMEGLTRAGLGGDLLLRQWQRDPVEDPTTASEGQ